ncbi:MAG: radical SAM protein [Proteobacteria bacterium]|nr:radical SAM protein [Pseudomonadota bacterium]MBU4009541.1 radical SAM protein [Pseudomonadota bacterium]
MALLVNEIFYSIQGESLYSGLPCTFVRLTGCNLRCTYCDTIYAYSEGTEIEIGSLVKKISDFGCSLVEITGGEPLIQDQSPALIEKLLDNEFTVLLETNGSIDISCVDKRCIKILDIKCPTSGESEKNNLANLNRLDKKDQIKFVIGNRYDYEFAKKIVKQIPTTFFRENILFSPVNSILELSELAQWILEDKLKVRFHLQLHKIIWPDTIRGV